MGESVHEEKVDSPGVTKWMVDRIHTQCFDPTGSSSSWGLLPHVAKAHDTSLHSAVAWQGLKLGGV